MNGRDAEYAAATERLCAIYEHYRRVTLGDALRLAEERKLAPDDALALLGRMAERFHPRPTMRWVIHDGGPARCVTSDVLMVKMLLPPAEFNAWARLVEIVWAASEQDALRDSLEPVSSVS